METFSVPFRFSGGLAVKHAEDDEQYYLHILSMVIQTQPGEMPLDANFGVNDPVFQRIETASIVELATKYVPELRIDRISTILDDEGVERLLVQYRL